MRLILIAAVVAALAGCSQVDMATKKVHDGVDSYCTRFTQDERTLFRGRVNPTPEGNSVTVNCAADG